MTTESQNRIKQIRERLGLSQKEFADKIGITKGYLSAIESNKRKPGRKIFEGIIQECLQDLVAVYGGKDETESPYSTVIAEPSPDWKQADSSMELSRAEAALVLTLRFLGSDHRKDLYYTVMSQARRAIKRREMERSEAKELKEALDTLGKAAIE